MHNAMDWDDLRYVLEVERQGSLSGASRALRVNHSTVFRRINSLEAKLGVRLFDRQRDGYLPTAAGEEVIGAARDVEEKLVSLDRRLLGQDLRPTGVVRVAMSDALTSTVVPLCGTFRRNYPGICVELVTSHEIADLTRRDADVAIRAGSKPPDNLHGRRIGRIAFSVYGSKQYLAKHNHFEEHEWIGLDDSLSNLPAHAYVLGKAAPDHISLKATSFVAMRDAACAGIGLTLLPCYMGDQDENLSRVGTLLPGTDLWLLVHDDLRHAARVRAFSDFIWEELRKLRPAMEAA